VVTVALWVRLEAKPGKEADVEAFLRAGLTLVEAEPATTAWFGIRLDQSTFGIFDAFPDEAGRSAHLSAASRRHSGRRRPNCSPSHRRLSESMSWRSSYLTRSGTD